MIKIGITQIKNSTEIENNFNSIMLALRQFQNTDANLILFPECSLSGFSAKMKNCTLDLVSDYLTVIEKWSRDHNKYVVFPTALVTDKVYNTGFIFGGEKNESFYKLGLTESEKKFFSVPDKPTKKVFRIKGYDVAILLPNQNLDPHIFHQNPKTGFFNTIFHGEIVKAHCCVFFSSNLLGQEQ